MRAQAGACEKSLLWSPCTLYLSDEFFHFFSLLRFFLIIFFLSFFLSLTPAILKIQSINTTVDIDLTEATIAFVLFIYICVGKYTKIKVALVNWNPVVICESMRSVWMWSTATADIHCTDLDLFTVQHTIGWNTLFVCASNYRFIVNVNIPPNELSIIIITKKKKKS